MKIKIRGLYGSASWCSTSRSKKVKSYLRPQETRWIITIGQQSSTEVVGYVLGRWNFVIPSIIRNKLHHSQETEEKI